MKATILTTLLAVSALFSVQASANNEIKVVPTNPTPLVGVWTNVNSSTGNIIRVVIRRVGSGVTVQPFGACSPIPCNHGILSARTFSPGVGNANASGFNAFRNFGFKTTSYIGIRQGTSLYLTTQNTFAAGDSRFNYNMLERFVRTAGLEAVDQPSQEPTEAGSASDSQ